MLDRVRRLGWLAFVCACGPSSGATESGTDTGSGDSGDSAETSPTGGPFSCEGLEAVPEAVFPERIAEVVCAQTVACGCSPGEKEMFQCKGWEEFFGDARTYAKEQGRVYDGMCVAQKLHALANAGCSERDYDRGAMFERV